MPAALEQQPAARHEQFTPAVADGVVKIQTVLTAVQRLVRLKIRDTAVERLHLITCDIRRIGNDNIENIELAEPVRRRLHHIGAHGQQSAAHEILDCLSKEELEQLSQYLDRLIQALEKQVDDARMDNNRPDWRAQANARMRDPRFEQLLSMRARAFGHRDRPVENSDDIPGAERFSPDYDGFVPQREDIPPLGGRRGTKE